jgi:hypothetical protein
MNQSHLEDNEDLYESILEYLNPLSLKCRVEEDEENNEDENLNLDSGDQFYRDFAQVRKNLFI